MGLYSLLCMLLLLLQPMLMILTLTLTLALLREMFLLIGEFQPILQ
jgi:hypothetical protein